MALNPSCIGRRMSPSSTHKQFDWRLLKTAVVYMNKIVVKFYDQLQDFLCSQCGNYPTCPLLIPPKPSGSFDHRRNLEGPQVRDISHPHLVSILHSLQGTGERL